MKKLFFFQKPKRPLNMNSVNKTRLRPSQLVRTAALFCFFLTAFLHFPSEVLAEGSKDFLDYDGQRLFLDTRDNQQMKVYAAAGEFINLGASHVGISGGFINVYRPDGTLHVTFDNSDGSGTAVIFNRTQEISGPTGNGEGYSPGVIAVDVDHAGVWTVVFDFPGESENSYDNILNGADWTRANDQPTIQRAVLAWDITVSQNAAGDAGGNLLTGRVYSNKYVSEVSENGNSTSPVFYILSRDGFTYQVNFNEIDPFRFTVGSNSFGITDGERNPIYRSVDADAYTVSRFPETWEADELYLYQLMAEDNEGLINNKVFFNLPAADLPDSATVTDIFAPGQNTHSTWLNNTPVFNPALTFTNFNFVGFDSDGIQCDPNTAQTGIGGFAVFDTNLGGTTTLELDLNGDGDFTDDIDRRIFTFVEAGTDSIFWDGNDGFGNPLPVDEGFTINYNISIRGGEIHIPIIDVENNPGGVTFNLINEAGNPIPTEFYYDNTNFPGGEVSGGGTGEPQPTDIPFTYDNNFGDNKIFDYWTFIQFEGNGAGSFTVTISDDCVCGEETTPIVTLAASADAYCAGAEEVVLTATNTQIVEEEIYFTFLEGENVIFRDTVIGNQSVAFSLGTAAPELAGTYAVFAENNRECVSDTATVTVEINPLPQVDSVFLESNTMQFCEGEDVKVLAFLTDALDYDFTLFDAEGIIIDAAPSQQNDTLILNLPNQTVSTNYSLQIENATGCATAENFAFEVQIAPDPQVSGFFQILPTDLCAGDSIVLNATTDNASNYTLILPDGSTVSDTVAADGSVSYIINDLESDYLGDYDLVLQNSNGCDSDTSSVSVNASPEPFPVFSLTGAGAYCEGEEINIEATNNTDGAGEIMFTVAGPGLNESLTVMNTDTATFVLNDFTADLAGEYTLDIESACQSQSSTFTLAFIDAVEYSNVSGADTYCAGDDAVLTAESNLGGDDEINYTWTGPDAFSFTGTAPVTGPFPATVSDISTASAGTYTLTLDLPNFACENEALTLDIAVNETPVIENVTGGGTYCQTFPVEFSAQNTNDAIDEITYTWLAPDGFSVTETIAGDQPLNFFTTELNDDWDGTWFLIVETNLGCAADSVPVEVMLDPAVVINNLTGEGTYCAGETINLSAANSNPNVETVIWTWENSNGIFASGTVNGTEGFSASIPNAGIQDTGEYILLLSTDNACPIGVGTFDIFIENIPVAAEIAGGGIVCPGEDVTLVGSNTAESTGAITFTWSGPNGFSETGTVAENGEIVTVISDVQAAQAGTYTLSLTTPNGCASAEVGTEVIIQNNNISDELTVDNEIACNGGQITFSADANIPDAEYEFFFTSNGNTVSLGSGNNANLTISPFTFDNEGEYFVEITGNCGAFAVSDAIDISVVSGVDAFEDEAETQQESPINIPVMDNDLMGNNSDFTNSISEAPQSGTAVFNDDDTVLYTPDAGFTGIDSFVYQICSEVCATTCDEAVVYVTVIGEDCFIPNYFTPNGDADNETFFVDCLENNFPENTILIFNRWGDEVYSAEPYNNDWDGKRDGDDLPAGTYFYLLNLTPDGENSRQGYITIVK